MNKPKYNICIPSYNRGKRALYLVEKLLQNVDDDCQIILLDNNSISQIEEYNQIKKMSEDSEILTYIKHNKNILFHGNYLASLVHATAPYVLIISDEDFPNLEGVAALISFLEVNRDVGIVRGSIAPLNENFLGNSTTYDDKVFSKGEEALLNFGFLNNYFSGTIYNIELIKKFDCLEKLATGMEKNRVYPHLYFELHVAAFCNCITTSIVSCFVGEEIFPEGGGGDPLMGQVGYDDYAPPYSYGSRVDQFVILRDAIVEVCKLRDNALDVELFFKLYAKLFLKYLYLIGQVNAPLYHKSILYIGSLKDSFYHLAVAGLVIYDEIRPYLNNILPQLQNLYEKYKDTN